MQVKYQQDSLYHLAQAVGTRNTQMSSESRKDHCGNGIDDQDHSGNLNGLIFQKVFRQSGVATQANPLVRSHQLMAFIFQSFRLITLDYSC